jgi:GrpB-like predicted nucleotidyltransferase (UPF0157 family)
MEQIRQHESGSRLPPLPAALAARLRELFADDVARLGTLLGRDLSAWTADAGRAGAAAARTGAGAGGGRLREVLEMVRVLKRIPPETRARHERVETLERKFARWQKVRLPELPLAQRPYDEAWPAWFAAERQRIAGALGPRAALVEHFGSTAVAGLSAKNIVDVAVGLDGPLDAAGLLAGIGYRDYGNSPIDPETLWLWRVEEDRAFVIHVCDRRRPWLEEQMALRDYLRAHAAEKERYAQLKRRLAEQTDQSFLRYTVSKLSLSIEMIDRAREWRAGSAGA